MTTNTNLVQVKVDLIKREEGMRIYWRKWDNAVTVSEKRNFGNGARWKKQTHFAIRQDIERDGETIHCLFNFEPIGNWSLSTGGAISWVDDVRQWKSWEDMLEGNMAVLMEYVEKAIDTHRQRQKSDKNKYWYSLDDVNFIIAFDVDVTTTEDWESGIAETEVEETFLGIVDPMQWTKQTFFSSK